MDWLRRNWPDLAIGIALIAVIAGIVATLITGGSFFPVGGTPGSTPTPDPVVSTPTPPAVQGDPLAPDAGADPAPVAGDDGLAGAADPAQQPGVGEVSPLTPDGAALPDAAAAPDAAQPDAAAVTPTPAPDQSPPAVVVTPVVPDQTPVSTPVVDPVVATPTPSPVEPAADPSPPTTPAGALPAASADEAAPFRVSAGAFGNPDNAARLAETLRQAGFPVFTGTQGNLTIVLVGPYENEAAADEVAARVAAGGFGVTPAVYRFRPDAADATAAVSTPAPAAAQDPAPETPAPAPVTPAPVTPTPVTPAPAAQDPVAAAPIVTSSSGRSLQVGAFADLASTAALRERLAGLGLVAFEVRENGLVKLLVGPFDEANLALARARLAQQGIESFPR